MLLPTELSLWRIVKYHGEKIILVFSVRGEGWVMFEEVVSVKTWSLTGKNLALCGVGNLNW